MTPLVVEERQSGNVRRMGKQGGGSVIVVVDQTWRRPLPVEIFKLLQVITQLARRKCRRLSRIFAFVVKFHRV